LVNISKRIFRLLGGVNIELGWVIVLHGWWVSNSILEAYIGILVLISGAILQTIGWEE